MTWIALGNGFVVLCLSLNIGCAARQDVRFQVVDAATRMPLAGVTGVAAGSNVNLLSARRGERQTLPPTSEAGVTEARGVDVGLAQHVAFSKDGYANAVASFSGRTLPTVYVTPYFAEKVLGPDRPVLPERAADGSTYYRIPLEPQGPKKGAADK